MNSFQLGIMEKMAQEFKIPEADQKAINSVDFSKINKTMPKVQPVAPMQPGMPPNFKMPSIVPQAPNFDMNMQMQPGAQYKAPSFNIAPPGLPG